MELLTQPANSKTCGHHCIAMICNVPVQDVINYIGHNKATKEWEIIKALRHFGKNTDSTYRPFKHRMYMTKVCIMIVKWKGRGAHALVYNHGFIYDPGQLAVFEFSNKFYGNRGKIIAHLNIW